MNQRTLIAVVSGVLACAAGAAVLLYVNRPRPPFATLWEAEDALVWARSSGASVHVADLLRAAEDSLRVAVEDVGTQSRRIYFLRDYTVSRRASEAARQDAVRAGSASLAASDALARKAAQALHTTAADLSNLRRALEEQRLDPAASATILRLELELTEGRQLWDRGLLQDSMQKIREVARGIAETRSHTQSKLDRYLEAEDQWNAWSRDVLAWSHRTGATALIVEKLAHTCRLYIAGRAVAIYDVDLGRRWMGDKQHEGDLTTPEGRYQVVTRLGPDASQYHKALRLDYPNEDDRRRYERAIATGRLSPDAGIGGLIEIHGHGGRGTDWTEGCIALANADMDELFDQVPVGTPVAIVGRLADDIQDR